MATITRKLSEINKDDDVSTGQALWYRGLSKAGKQAELERRAKSAGTTYVRDGSYDGLKEDGSAEEKAKMKRAAKGLRLTARRKAEIERRIKSETAPS